MGTYDLEKEIYHILQDSSKIRGYNARLRNEYINLNDENRQLKIKNSKLVFQNACTEISLAKAKASAPNFWFGFVFGSIFGSGFGSLLNIFWITNFY